MSRVIKGATLGPLFRTNGALQPVKPQSGQALLAEARAEAERLKRAAAAELAAAQAEAEALIREAEEQAATLVSEAEARAEGLRQEAHAAGFAAGKAEALAALEAELTAQRAAVQAELEAQRQALVAERAALAAEHQAYLKGLQEPLLQLVMAAAEQVVRGELASRPEQVAVLVAAGLSQLAGETEPRLRVSPSDRPVLEEQQGLLLSQLPEAQELQFEEDPSLAPGEFIAVGQGGLVDGRYRAQLLAIEEALAPYLAPEE